MVATPPRGTSVDFESDARAEPEGGDEYEAQWLAIGLGASVAFVGAGCTAEQSPGNGDLGIYLSTDQALDAGPIDSYQVPIGKLEVFDQTRLVCTNSCEPSSETVGLLTLTPGLRADFPVVMFPSGWWDVEEMLDIAGRFVLA